jgi:hypothetical protein
MGVTNANGTSNEKPFTLTAAVTTFTDTDATTAVSTGKNPSVIGTCTDGNGGKHTDVCTSSTNLTEYYIGTAGSCPSYTVTCNTWGMVCKSGTCVYPSTASNISISQESVASLSDAIANLMAQIQDLLSK